jgi:hypothetical protein
MEPVSRRDTEYLGLVRSMRRFTRRFLALDDALKETPWRRFLSGKRADKARKSYFQGDLLFIVYLDG